MEEEKQVTLQDALDAIKQEAELYKAIIEKAVDLNATPIRAEISQKSLESVEKAAKKGVENTTCQLPDSSQLAKDVATDVMQIISTNLGAQIKAETEKHKTQIEVHHEHYYNNMYGWFASSETNRNMMCWLAFCAVLPLSVQALYLLRWFAIIDWEEKLFPWLFIATIGIVFFGFIIRLCSKPKRH